MDNGNFTVVGKEADGTLLCKTDDGEVYNCGLTVEEFGPDDLTEAERLTLGLPSN